MWEARFSVRGKVIVCTANEHGIVKVILPYKGGEVEVKLESQNVLDTALQACQSMQLVAEGKTTLTAAFYPGSAATLN